MERIDPIEKLSNELIKNPKVTGRWIGFQFGGKTPKRVLIIEENGRKLSMVHVDEKGEIIKTPGKKTIQRVNRAYPCRVIKFHPRVGGEPITLEDHEF